tara:strand:+ start:114 stop:1820 length:1707 start_codon:yes stop_codon:yes gene_type:complete
MQSLKSTSTPISTSSNRIRRTQSAIALSKSQQPIGSPTNEAIHRSPKNQDISSTNSDSDGHFQRHYEHVERLGEGAFGSVYSAKSLTDGRRYAVKRIPFFFQAHEAFGLAKLRTQVLREGKILAALDHPNVVRYYQCWVERVGIVRKHPDEVEVASTNTPLPLREATNETDEELNDDDEDETINAKELDNASFLLNQTTESWWADLDCEMPAVPNMNPEEPNSKLSKSSQKLIDSMDSMDPSSVDDGKVLLLQIDLFIVMKLYDRSLKLLFEYRRPSEISKARNVRIMQQLLEACNYIHTKGVVHRDISPCNVFFDNKGEAVLGDFGLASADSKHRLREINNQGRGPSMSMSLSSSSFSRSSFSTSKTSPTLTSTSTSTTSPFRKSTAPRPLTSAPRPILRVSTQAVLNDTLSSDDSNSSGTESDPIGKPLYAAPEQWENPGLPGSSTTKADIFSLGVLWVEMFSHFTTGRERIEVLMNVRKGTLEKSFVQLYPKVAALALKMLSRNPKVRTSAGELLKDSLFTGGGLDNCECEDEMREECCNRAVVLKKRIELLESFITKNGMEVPT